MTTIKKVKKIAQAMNNEGTEKEAIVRAIYHNLERECFGQAVERKQLIARMKWSRMYGGCSMSNDFEAEMFLKMLESRGAQFNLV